MTIHILEPALYGCQVQAKGTFMIGKTSANEMAILHYNNSSIAND